MQCLDRVVEERDAPIPRFVVLYYPLLTRLFCYESYLLLLFLCILLHITYQLLTRTPHLFVTQQQHTIHKIAVQCGLDP